MTAERAILSCNQAPTEVYRFCKESAREMPAVAVDFLRDLRAFLCESLRLKALKAVNAKCAKKHREVRKDNRTAPTPAWI
jgi:hypothetical protein